MTKQLQADNLSFRLQRLCPRAPVAKELVFWEDISVVAAEKLFLDRHRSFRSVVLRETTV